MSVPEKLAAVGYREFGHKVGENATLLRHGFDPRFFLASVNNRTTKVVWTSIRQSEKLAARSVEAVGHGTPAILRLFRGPPPTGFRRMERR